jgi:hypothetical protein
MSAWMRFTGKGGQLPDDPAVKAIMAGIAQVMGAENVPGVSPEQFPGAVQKLVSVGYLEVHIKFEARQIRVRWRFREKGMPWNRGLIPFGSNDRKH